MPILNIAHEDKFEDLTAASTDAEIRANGKVREEYGDLLDRYPNHPVVIDPRGSGRVLRWKANPVVKWLTGRAGINEMWEAFYGRNLPVEDLATVYRMMGYSLCGFIEVFGEHMELEGKL